MTRRITERTIFSGFHIEIICVKRAKTRRTTMDKREIVEGIIAWCSLIVIVFAMFVIGG